MRELRGCVHIDAVSEVGIDVAEAIYLEDPNLFKLHGYEEDEAPVTTPDIEAKKVAAEVLTSAKMAVYFDVLDDDERQVVFDGATAMFAALSQPVAVAK